MMRGGRSRTGRRPGVRLKWGGGPASSTAPGGKGGRLGRLLACTALTLAGSIRVCAD